jgi:hypothetical protein
MVGFSECNNEPINSMKVGECLDFLYVSQISKEDSDCFRFFVSCTKVYSEMAVKFI